MVYYIQRRKYEQKGGGNKMVVAGAYKVNSFRERTRVIKDLERKYYHKGIRIDVEGDNIFYDYREDAEDGSVLNLL